jgi:hypothetical protein
MEVKGQNCSASSSYCDRLPLGDFNHNMLCGLGTPARSEFFYGRPVTKLAVVSGAFLVLTRRVTPEKV